jgi:polyhydroxyalkanoate synthesis regulator phasin
MNNKFPKVLIVTVIIIISTNPSWGAPPPNPTKSDAFFNTAGGTGVLINNIGSFINTGTNNTGFGESALKSNTDGDSNTAVGSFALADNTTGNFNTANGINSLIHNTIGFGNTATGAFSLKANTTGNGNTANGASTLSANTIGKFNTAIGGSTLSFNTIGENNTATGVSALQFNSTGNFNTAGGVNALSENDQGSFNSAFGHNALAHNHIGDKNSVLGDQGLFSKTDGNSNLALGYNAGFNLVSGSNNIYLMNLGVSAESNTIRVGLTTHLRTFISGIRGKTVGANAVPVVIDSNGRLGTVVSSARFKKDIQDMNEASRKLLQLRPVTYRYKEADESGANPIEYGLIAEEVAKVYPDLVAFGADGKIETVQYQKLTPMLLNEVKWLNKMLENEKQQSKGLEKELKDEHLNNQQQAQEIESLKNQVAGLTTQTQMIKTFSDRLTKLETQQMVVLNH